MSPPKPSCKDQYGIVNLKESKKWYALGIRVGHDDISILKWLRGEVKLLAAQLI